MTIVFTFIKILRNSHRHIFGLDKLIEDGHNVILLDLGRMYGWKRNPDDELILQLRKIVIDKSDLVKFRDSLDSKPALYVCNDTYLLFAHEAFEILMRKQDRLLAFKTKPTPFQDIEEKGIKLILKKILKNLKGFPAHYLKPFYLANKKYFVPDYYLCSTNYNLPLKAFLTVQKENIIIAHSDDVNSILEDITEQDKDERIGVFLDQVLPFAYSGEVDEEEYYQHLERVLHDLKEYLGLDKILIAEHPASASIIDELKDKFKGFARSRGDTQKLIKNATYVFAHYSTAIGLAAYYEKPVILLLDDNLRKVEWITRTVNTYRDLFSLPVVDMQQRNLKVIEHYEPDLNKYKDYVSKFMKDDDTVQENSYHFAIRRIIEDINKVE